MAGAGRLALIAVEALGVVLRLAVDQERAAAAMGEEEVDLRCLEVEADGALVDRGSRRGLELRDADDVAVGTGVQLEAVDDVRGSHRASVVVELGILVQCEGPLGEIVVVLPARGQAAGVVEAGLGIVADEPLKGGA